MSHADRLVYAGMSLTVAGNGVMGRGFVGPLSCAESKLKRIFDPWRRGHDSASLAYVRYEGPSMTSIPASGFPELIDALRSRSKDVANWLGRGAAGRVQRPNLPRMGAIVR